MVKMEKKKITSRIKGLRKHLRPGHLMIPVLAAGMHFGGIFKLDGENNGITARYGKSAPIKSDLIAREQNILADHIQANNPDLSLVESEKLARLILEESTRLIIPESMIIDGRPVHPAYFLAAMIHVESSFKKNAVSTSDARGYMQVKPMTARWLDSKSGNESSDERLFHGQTNIRVGVDYLNSLVLEMPDMRKVALSYNAGPTSVKRGIYEERYWTKILSVYRSLQKTRMEEQSDMMLAIAP